MISMVFVWVFLSLSVSASEYIHDTIHRPLQSRTSNSPNEHDSSGGNQTGRVSSVYDTELIRFSNALRIAFQRWRKRRCRSIWNVIRRCDISDRASGQETRPLINSLSSGCRYRKCRQNPLWVFVAWSTDSCHCECLKTVCIRRI